MELEAGGAWGSAGNKEDSGAKQTTSGDQTFVAHIIFS